MRKYSEAWQELRDKYELTIVAPRHWHQRIYNGIRKERYKDSIHALFLAETKQVDRVTYRREGERMLLTLARIPAPLSLTDLF